MTGRKTGCNRSRPVFFGFSIFRQTSQLATEKNQNLCNRNWWSGLFQLGSVRFRSFFQSSELDLRTLYIYLLIESHEISELSHKNYNVCVTPAKYILWVKCSKDICLMGGPWDSVKSKVRLNAPDTLSQGRTSYLSIGHMSKHMLIGGINALPYSSHMPTVHIWNLIQVSSKMQIS